jgi:hypothetical protein
MSTDGMMQSLIKRLPDEPLPMILNRGSRRSGLDHCLGQHLAHSLGSVLYVRYCWKEDSPIQSDLPSFGQFVEWVTVNVKQAAPGLVIVAVEVTMYEPMRDRFGGGQPRRIAIVNERIALL